MLAINGIGACGVVGGIYSISMEFIDWLLVNPSDRAPIPPYMPTNKAESGPPPNTLRAPGHNGRSTHPKKGEERRQWETSKSKKKNRGQPCKPPKTQAHTLIIPKHPLWIAQVGQSRGLSNNQKQTGHSWGTPRILLLAELWVPQKQRHSCSFSQAQHGGWLPHPFE